MSLTPTEYDRGYAAGTNDAAIEPRVFIIGDVTGVAVGGRFHGWLMRRHPDGQWVSVRKLEAVDPFDNPLGQMLKSTVQK